MFSKITKIWLYRQSAILNDQFMTWPSFNQSISIFAIKGHSPLTQLELTFRHIWYHFWLRVLITNAAKCSLHHVPCYWVWSCCSISRFEEPREWFKHRSAWTSIRCTVDAWEQTKVRQDWFVLRTLVLHCVSKKNDNDVLRYNFNAHQPIVIIFGRDIAEWICY